MKNEPLRMCAVCRGMFPKGELLRIVRNKDESFSVDGTGKAQGRGAYVCRNGACIEKCVKKRLLNKTFKCSIKDEVYDEIARFKSED